MNWNPFKKEDKLEDIHSFIFYTTSNSKYVAYKEHGAWKIYKDGSSRELVFVGFIDKHTNDSRKKAAENQMFAETMILFPDYLEGSNNHIRKLRKQYVLAIMAPHDYTALMQKHHQNNSSPIQELIKKSGSTGIITHIFRQIA